jgi:hypothetical protein
VKARLYRSEARWEGVEVRLSIQQYLMRSAVQYALAQAAKSQKSLAEGRALACSSERHREDTADLLCT